MAKSLFSGRTLVAPRFRLAASGSRIAALQVAAGLLALSAFIGAPVAEAGCYCQKPPPPPAQVRPNVVYAGMPVTLFSPLFEPGEQYIVTFGSGTTPVSKAVVGEVESRRDLADGEYKPQLVVPLPSMPLGPARITVTSLIGGAEALTIDDESFTVAPEPIAFPVAYGTHHWPDFRAAVGRDGVAYIALDVSDLTQPVVFEARALGYPLRFTNQDVVFHNTQGFLMQLLVDGSGPEAASAIPGMFVFPASSGAPESDTLHYSRHEFTTYFLQHQERQPHQVDPADPNWHLDGTPHIDHDHLILAIMGHMDDGSPLVPGATPRFDLNVDCQSLFNEGLVGISSVRMSQSAIADSYDSDTAISGTAGDVFSTGRVSLSGKSTIMGDATAGRFRVSSGSRITGTTASPSTAVTFLQVQVPVGIPDLGVIDLHDTTQTIVGTGSFKVTKLEVRGHGRLFIDNTAGPVTLYVMGRVLVTGNGAIQVADPKPEKFAVYLVGDARATLRGSGNFDGVVYAPKSTISLAGEGDFTGAFVAKQLNMSKRVRVHYDSTLRGPQTAPSRKE